MKTIASIFLLASSLLSTAVAIISTTSTYTLKIVNSNPRLNAHESLYELKSTAKQTHFVLNGDPIAPQLFESPIGKDPASVANKTVTRDKFLVKQEFGRMYLESIEDVKNVSGTYDGPGSWRACNGSTVDYQLYWFDRLHNLTAVAGQCESVTLELTGVIPSPSTIIVPAKTFVTSGYITGVTAQTSSCITSTSTSTTGFITGSPTPSRPSSSNATPSSTVLPQITIRIYNDETGANAAATVYADGVSHDVSDLFRGTSIDNNGDIVGTSAQLVKFLNPTKCSMTNFNVRDWVVELDDLAKKIVNLDRDTSKGFPVWLGGFTLTCQA